MSVSVWIALVAIVVLGLTEGLCTPHPGNYLILFGYVAIRLTMSAFTAFGSIGDRRCNAAIQNVDNSKLLQIYAAVEALGQAPAHVFRLGRLNIEVPHKRVLIPLPQTPLNRPWEGRTIEVTRLSDNQFDSAVYVQQPFLEHAEILGQKFALVGVPRRKLKNGKVQNRFQYEEYLRQSGKLRGLITQIFPGYKPLEISELLFDSVGSGKPIFLSDPRIGGYPDWIQNPEFPNCEQCGKRMTKLIEFREGLAAGKPSEGKVYVFSCIKHPNEIASVVQFS